MLQYVLGFRQLGHEVYLVEPVPAKSLRPAGTSLTNSENGKYFRQVVTEFELIDHSALLAGDSKETCGLSYSQLETIARRAPRTSDAKPG